MSASKSVHFTPTLVPFRFYRRAVALTTIFGLALLMGCQSPSKGMPVEEARSVAIQLDSPRFHPPPRTIVDVRELLGQLDESKLDCVEVRREWHEADRYLISSVTRLDNPGLWAMDLHSFRMGYKNYAVRSMSVGRMREARSALDQALEAASERGRDFETAYFHSVTALLYASVGDSEAAENALEQTRIGVARVGGRQWSLGAQREFILDFAIAAAGVASGDPRRAEKAIRDAYPKARWPDIGSELAGEVPWLAGKLVDSLLQQGRLVEAEIEARKALKESIRVYANVYDIAARAHMAIPVMQLAAVMLEQERLDEAEYLAREAIRILERNCADPEALQLTDARRVLLRVLAAQSDWDAIVREADRIRALSKDRPTEFQRLYGRELEIGVADTLAGQIPRGLRHLEDALSARTKYSGATSYAVAEAHVGLGIGLWQTGDREAALSAFQRGIPSLLDDEQRTGAGARRSLRRGLLQIYMELVSEALESGAFESKRTKLLDSLFHAAQVANLGTVQAALSAAGVRSVSGDDDLSLLIREDQDLSLGITALLDHLNYIATLPSDEVEQELEFQLQDQVQRLREAKQIFKVAITERFPTYQHLVSPKPMSIAEVDRHLKDDEALLFVASTPNRTLVWAINEAQNPSFAALGIGKNGLASKVRRIRAGLAPPEVTTVADIPQYDVNESYELFRTILMPVAPGWKGSSYLFTVTPGPLGSLPLSVLTTKPSKSNQSSKLLFSSYRRLPWLARTHAVAVLPSVSTLRLISSTPRGPAQGRAFIGFGDPIFSDAQPGENDLRTATRGARSTVQWRNKPSTRQFDSAALSMLPPLPETAREITEVAKALGSDPVRDIYLGHRATEHNVKSNDFTAYRILAFATHGLVPGDLDGLDQPALALSVPAPTDPAADDGLLTLDEILALDLNADWAVLSACNTGAADGRGSEAVSGLGRAFFYAGARAILVSNWPVHSKSTTELMIKLFELQAHPYEKTGAEALRRASMWLLDEGAYHDATGTVAFAYAHPIFWAPFTAVGNTR